MASRGLIDGAINAIDKIDKVDEESSSKQKAKKVDIKQLSIYGW